MKKDTRSLKINFNLFLTVSLWCRLSYRRIQGTLEGVFKIKLAILDAKICQSEFERR